MESRTEDHKWKVLEPLFPAPPEKPLDSDCCGNGCNPCIFDIYQKEVALWEAECELLRKGEKGEKRSEVQLQKEMYASFHIEGITAETENVLRVRCSLRQHQVLGLTMGQHIVVRCRRQDGSAVTRQYTPISPLDAKGYFELLIKIYPRGQMSQLISTWKVQDKLEARGPYGYLPYARNKYGRVLMLCAGTGVAPMCQVIHTILCDPEEETLLRLVYASRTYPELIARQELGEWKRYWNFSALYILSQESSNPAYKYKFGDQIVNGRVNQALVKKEIGDELMNTMVLVCGTKSFGDSIRSILAQLDLPQDNLHVF